ncbi:hypothetical protein SPRG_14466 [Saprolegnia parasitica CBS 223.65]|uniref:Uncharacterized protein n=1 Tax=Saprolegnia parasitica (strain CBS 223.65) TaxID=695850 RepID=A0A067BTT1_SAPPC|nr:hypothetical protein SPRG_14466 [Saprolegnia parasitica CBS 223.65]KDO20220.1 hypothetical protein SPRG_14466 [Saprolegnia parasitica CBS 223.65]|eukprot:XP_012209033.1 hypothetical protein SPRG_14466 [Saprolegnia parasitica CBS 223.65]
MAAQDDGAERRKNEDDARPPRHGSVSARSGQQDGGHGLAKAVMESAMPEKSRLEWLALHKAWMQAATTTDAVAKKNFANLILTSATFHDRVAALLKMSKSAMSAKGSFLGAAAIDKLRVAVLVSNVAVERGLEDATL